MQISFHFYRVQLFWKRRYAEENSYNCGTYDSDFRGVLDL